MIPIALWFFIGFSTFLLGYRYYCTSLFPFCFFLVVSKTKHANIVSVVDLLDLVLVSKFDQAAFFSFRYLLLCALNPRKGLVFFNFRSVRFYFSFCYLLFPWTKLISLEWSKWKGCVASCAHNPFSPLHCFLFLFYPPFFLRTHLRTRCFISHLGRMGKENSNGEQSVWW